MYCGRCGNELKGEARFCGSCGAPADLFSRGGSGGGEEATADTVGVSNVAAAVSQAKARGRRRIPLVLLIALALSLVAGTAFASWWVYTEVIRPMVEEVEPSQTVILNASVDYGEPEKGSFELLEGDLTEWEEDGTDKVMLRVGEEGDFKCVVVVTSSRLGYYCCAGRFSTPMKTDDYTYTFGVAEIYDSVYSMDAYQQSGKRSADFESYFDQWSKMDLYLPGKPISEIPESGRYSWASLPSESGLLIEPIIVIDDNKTDSSFFAKTDLKAFEEYWQVMD